jgi:ABC-2 type transport system ATP-binding protein
MAAAKGKDAAEGLHEMALSEESGLLTVTGAEPAEITRLLAGQGLYVERLVPSRRGLEQIFLELTQEDTLPTQFTQPAPGDEGAR